MSSPSAEPGTLVDGDWTGRRADARRNHDEVFAAAVALFAEKGDDATIPEIAARAGVGKATVYRSYPTKADLVEAVAQEQVRWLDARVRAAKADETADAFAALELLLGDISGRLAQDRLFAQVLTRAKVWGDDRGHTDAIAEMVRRAQRQGLVRADATTQDVRVLMGGYARVLLDLGVRDADQWRRYARLVLNALRPDQVLDPDATAADVIHPRTGGHQ